MTSPVSRRTVLGGAFATAVLLSGCSDSRSSRPTSSGWRFTDSRGRRIELAESPKTIVAFSTTTAALSEMGVKTQGIFAWASLKDDAQLKDVDLTGVVSIGEVWGELDLERLVELSPDLVVTGYDPTDKSLYGISDEQRAQIEKIAPVLGLDNTAPLTNQFDRLQDLGRALGADLSSTTFLEARERFNELSQQLERVASTKPGLRVMAVSSTDDGMNVAQPAPNPDLGYYEDLGVSFVVPEGNGTFWWKELASENLDKYPADVILVDARSGNKARSALEEHPLWASLPAVKAGQVFPWHAYDPATYTFYIKALEDLVSAMKSSGIVT